MVAYNKKKKNTTYGIEYKSNTGFYCLFFCKLQMYSPLLIRYRKTTIWFIKSVNYINHCIDKYNFNFII